MKTYKELLESININEKTLTIKDFKKGMWVTLKGKVGQVINVAPRGGIIEVEFNDKKLGVKSVKPEKLQIMKEETELEEEVYTEEEIALYELDDEAFEDVIKKKSATDRKMDAKKRKKWAKTAGGKKSAKKSEKRADKVKKGTVKVDKKKSRLMKKVKKVYK